MKVEGMDAVPRTATVPAYSPDQPQPNSKAASAKRIKQADNADQIGASGNAPSKIRVPADSQSFDKMFQNQDESATEKVIREAIERANRVLSGSDRKFEISVHEKTKDIMVKVVDTTTNETIREIPPKKIVDLVVRLCEIAGILFDEKG